MAISIVCQQCGAGYRVDDKLVGRKATCRKCGATFEVRARSASSPAPQVEIPQTSTANIFAAPTRTASSGRSKPSNSKGIPRPVFVGVIGVAVLVALLMVVGIVVTAMRDSGDRASTAIAGNGGALKPSPGVKPAVETTTGDNNPEQDESSTPKDDGGSQDPKETADVPAQANPPAGNTSDTPEENASPPSTQRPTPSNPAPSTGNGTGDGGTPTATAAAPFKLAKGQEILKLQGYPRIRSVDASSDGQFILAGGGDGLLRLWDANTGKEIRQFAGHTSSIGPVAFSPDGTRVFSGSWDRTMRMWNVQSGELVREFRGHRFPVLTLAVSPDGKQALSGSDGFRLWDIESGKVLHHFTAHTKTVWSVTFSPDGKRALSTSWNQTVRLWDLTTFKELRLFKNRTNHGRCVRFSPDGKFAACCDSASGKVYLWELDNDFLVDNLTGHPDGVGGVAFSPDGRFLLSSGGRQDPRTGAFLPGDGTSIVLWDLSKKRELLRMKGHETYIAGVVFSPDGRKAISASGDGTVRVWRLFEDDDGTDPEKRGAD